MGVATVNGGLLAVWIDSGLPDSLGRALSCLCRFVTIPDAHPDLRVVRAASDLLEASRTNRTATAPGIQRRYPTASGLAGLGFDEPAPRAFLGSNRLRPLEAVLP